MKKLFLIISILVMVVSCRVESKNSTESWQDRTSFTVWENIKEGSLIFFMSDSYFEIYSSNFDRAFESVESFKTYASYFLKAHYPILVSTDDNGHVLLIYLKILMKGMSLR
ncbi:hypothetical protein [Brachyspira sp.]|uniref:hypothetical protein n=1 Tax=Brachyspira sp. TaxID=1977261 RepID=UPI00262C720C|nr:hypothetical protein [Brachyspira sp.]